MANLQRKCKVCGDILPNVGELTKHRKENHPDEHSTAIEQREKTRGRTPKKEKQSNESNNGKNQPLRVKGKTVSELLDPGTSVTIIPKAFTITSGLFWQAKKAAITELGFPPDISDEDFLDTFLYRSMAANGIILGGYTVINSDNGGNGNGHSDDDTLQQILMDTAKLAAETAAVETVKTMLTRAKGGK